MAQKILLAIDGSEPSLKAVRYVGETVAGCKEVKIVLFSVLPEIHKGLADILTGDFARLAFSQGMEHIKSLRFQKEKELKEAQEKAKEILINSGIPAGNIEMKLGRKKEGIARDIIREVESGDYDTVVVGRRGMGRAFFMGSVSTKIVNNLRNCTVWVVD